MGTFVLSASCKSFASSQKTRRTIHFLCHFIVRLNWRWKHPFIVKEIYLLYKNKFAGDFVTPTDDIPTNLEEDNYEEQLRVASEMDEFSSMKTYEELKFIDFFGTDKQGQHIFAIFACRLPPKSELNNSAFIHFIIQKMEAFVQNDYVLVYFHQGLRDNSKPSVDFLWNSYKELDRSFKKNLKHLYVVHPTMFIRVIWNLCKPFISVKFKNKLCYVSSLEELRENLGLKSLKLPENIYE